MAITRAKKTPHKPTKPIQGDPAKSAEEFIDKAEPVVPTMPIAASPIDPPTEIPVAPQAAAPVEAATQQPAPAAREQQALTLVKGYLPWAAGAGVVPYPGLNLAAIVAVQLRMLAKLAEQYQIPFEGAVAKSIVATLLATVVEGTLAGGLRSLAFMLPVVGQVISVIALPSLATAGTYAIGKIFITHFESGGTFLDFDPKKVEAHFRAEFAAAKAQGV